jgi:hypothetical protein
MKGLSNIWNGKNSETQRRVPADIESGRFTQLMQWVALQGWSPQKEYFN